MKKTETKKHHFVPRTYLKNFSHKKNDDFYVNVLHKDQPIDKIFENLFQYRSITETIFWNNLLKSKHDLGISFET